MNYSVWDQILKSHVKLGSMDGISSLNVLDYSAIYSNVDLFIVVLCQFKNSNISNFTRTEYYAFWINAYNVLSVNTVLRYPCQSDLFGNCSALTSITQIGVPQPNIFFGDAVWKYYYFNVGGQSLNLNEILEREN